MLRQLYPDRVDSVPRYPIGHVATSSAGITFRCWVCAQESISLIKVASCDWRCRECIPDSLKPPAMRSHHGNRVLNAVRDCAPALALWAESIREHGLQEVPVWSLREAELAGKL